MTELCAKVVELKAQAAREWCQKVTEFTGERWAYAKVLQADFERFSGLGPARLFQMISES